MKVYAVIGYIDEDDRTDNSVFGVYVDRKKAEEKLIEVARDALDYEDTFRDIPCSRECYYINGRLVQIQDTSEYSVDVRIVVTEYIDN